MPSIRYIDKGGRPRTRETILASRPHRKPLSGARDVLAVNGVPRGLHTRWVNDIDDRILRFQEAGYDFITDKGVTVGTKTVDQNPDTEEDIGSVVCRRVGTRDGQPLTAYLMAIEEEFYEEDCKRKYDHLDRTQKALTTIDPAQGQYGAISIS